MGTELLHFDVFDLPAQDASIPRLEGENAREILLFYSPVEDPALIEFLQRVLWAAQVDMAKDTHHGEISQGMAPHFVHLDRKLRFNTLLVFGLTPQDFGLQINWAYYAPVLFRGKTLLFCDALSLLMEERARGGSERSGPLWVALKHILLKK